MTATVQEINTQQLPVLAQNVVTVVRSYLGDRTNKTSDLNLYQVVVQQVEAPLIRTVMELMRYNQSKAARALGMSRGTLRTKLKEYFGDEFIGTREA